MQTDSTPPLNMIRLPSESYGVPPLSANTIVPRELAGSAMGKDTQSPGKDEQLKEKMSDVPPVLALGNSQGRKYDSGKAPLAQGCLAYFKNGLNAVANISAYGAKKYGVEYADQNWRRVDNARGRYMDAMARHLAAYAAGERLDPESGLPHIDHAAWNALALIELDKNA